MTEPANVTAHPEMDWISIDDGAWITGNVRDEAASLSQVYVAHIDPATGEECKRSPRSIRPFQVDSRDPLTITPELYCFDENPAWCAWRGTIRDGHWVDAA